MADFGYDVADYADIHPLFVTLKDFGRPRAATPSAPMPWDAAPLGGFTAGTPWLPLGEHATINVTSESAAPRSTLAL